MPWPSQLTVEKVEGLLRKHHGIYAAVARSCKVTRQAVQQFVEAHPELKEVVADAREVPVDDAEISLFKAAKKGSAWAVRLLLITRGKSRGYVEKAELDLSKLSDDEVEQFHKLFSKAAGGAA